MAAKFIIVNRHGDETDYFLSPKGKAAGWLCNWWGQNKAAAKRYVSETAARKAIARMSLGSNCEIEKVDR